MHPQEGPLNAKFLLKTAIHKQNVVNKVQPTAIARCREGIARGSQYAPSGRPPKRKVSAEDCHTQTKRGKQDHTKRKHSLSLNVK